MLTFNASAPAQQKQQEWQSKMQSLSQGERDQMIFSLLRKMRVHEERAVLTRCVG